MPGFNRVFIEKFSHKGAKSTRGRGAGTARPAQTELLLVEILLSTVFLGGHLGSWCPLQALCQESAGACLGPRSAACTAAARRALFLAFSFILLVQKVPDQDKYQISASRLVSQQQWCFGPRVHIASDSVSEPAWLWETKPLP